MAPDQYNFQRAIHDFQTARQRASIQEILARFSGESAQLFRIGTNAGFAGVISPLGLDLRPQPTRLVLKYSSGFILP